MDQGEQLGQEQLGYGHRRQSTPADEDGGDVQLLAQAGQVLFPVKLGDEDGGPHTGPGDDIDEQVHHTLGHAQGGKGAVADIAGDHQRIDDVIQLLEHVGAQQGQAQLKQLGQNGTGGEMELFGHGGRPPFLSIIKQNENFVKPERKIDRK